MSNVYVENASVLNYKVPYVVDGELVTPSSAFISITNNAGDPIQSITNIALTIGAGATSSVYIITALANTSSLDYEIRYVKVKFTYNSKDYYYSDFYVIRDNLRVPVTAQDVRAFGGFTGSQIRDEQIDVFQAYAQLQADVTEANLDTLLSAGSSLIPYIQLGVKAKALMSALVTIETSIFQSEQSDNTNYKRFTGIDYNEMLARINLAYSQAVGKLNGTLPGDAISFTLFTVVTGIDPITGQ